MTALSGSATMEALRRFPRWNVVGAWACFVAGIWILAAIVGRTLPTRNGAPPPRPIAAVLATWDGGHYAQIAQDGYSPEGVRARLFGHFPLLPMLARALGWSWSTRVLAGVVVSQLALLAA